MNKPVWMPGLLLLVMVGALGGQGPLQPVGEAFFAQNAAVTGTNWTLEFGDARVGNASVLLGLSDGPGPTLLPGLGTLQLDLLSPAYINLPFVSDATGAVISSTALPNDPALVGGPPLFAAALVAHPSLPGGWSLSRTARLEILAPGSLTPGPTTAVARAFHRATALGGGGRDPRTRVLVSGGGGGDVLAPVPSRTTEIVDAVARTVLPGPDMAVARAFHGAVRLADGRVLVCGGTDAAGNVTAGCELFDPVTLSFAPTGSMTTPRAAHAATLLPDGRVLVSGGLTTYVQALTNAFVVMNSAQSSAELYDPATGVWTAVGMPMASKRSGHTQTLLADGRVLLVSGIDGAVNVLGFGLPTFTPSCEIFDPASNTFSAAPSIAPGRAFHAASLLGNGEVLVSGGLAAVGVFGSAATISSSLRLVGPSWQSAAALPLDVAFHVQESTAGGAALVLGGLSGNINGLSAVSLVGLHAGTSYAPRPALAGARAAAAATRLVDGTLLIAGGLDAGGQARADALIYADE